MGEDGWRNLFTKPIDFTSYHENGNTPIAEDDYGKICKYTDLKTVIQWLEKYTNGYRRAEALLDLLKSFDNEKWINGDWEILILHYGYYKGGENMVIVGIIAVVIMWLFILSLLAKDSVKTIISAIFIVAIFLLSYGISWIVTCGIVKLLSMCFGFAFTWQIATGIWIVLCLLRWVISAAKPSKK